ncbi:hypothetical protein [Desnuesiella massiliensis]|uniref:hypothetical protein n=1 Tax=Desnuesiella massiliensis TaxID=1650662 RepID=UPI0006E1252B|nr:hypothetical protein [Desnuesiella massiliensis]
MKNKLKVFIALACFILFFISGCSESQKENLMQNNSKVKNESTTLNNTSNNKHNTKKEFDLLSYIGKSKDIIKKDFGNPNKIDGVQAAELYDYDTFYFAIDNNKVINIGVKDSGSTINGIGIGMTAKDVKAKLGDPTKESNNNNFIMEYRLNNNTTSVQYYCNDFRSPVNLIIVTDLTHGKEKPMDVTKEQAESLIEGNWILEKYIKEKNLSLYISTFSNGVWDKHLGIWSKKYNITSNNTVMITYMVNDISGTREESTEYHIEFYEDGDRMEIYPLDKYGDRNTDYQYIYCRYN